MNTIEFNGSFLITKNFMEGGEKLFGSNAYNNLISKYFNYLKSLNQAHNTLRHKTTNVSLFIQYLEKTIIFLVLKDLKWKIFITIFNYMIVMIMYYPIRIETN